MKIKSKKDIKLNRIELKQDPDDHATAVSPVQ